MAVGKSRRIVIDVDDVSLKRNLYAALAEDGRSLKEWFLSAVDDYLESRAAGQQLELAMGVAERSSTYVKTREGKSNG